MSLDRFIKWDKIWDEEICIDSHDLYGEKQELVNRFKKESNLSLVEDECYETLKEGFVFHWAYFFGQNESDTQGSFINFDIITDEEFYIIDINYNQG